MNDQRKPRSGGRKRTGTLILDRKSGKYLLRVMVDGKFLCKTTGERSYRAADARRADLLADLGVVSRAKADILANVVDKLESENAKVARAAATYQTKKDREKRESQRLPLAGTWEAFLRIGRPDTGEATLRVYKLQWDAFTEWLQGNGVKRLADLTPELAVGFFNHLQEHRHLSAGTYNKYLQTLRLVTSHLPPAEDIPPGVFGAVKRKRDVQEVHKEISLDMLWKLCEAADGEMKVMIFLGAYTGLRLKDCCLLSWDEVDLLSGLIRHVPYKMASRRAELLLIPIHPSLRAMLETTPKENRTGYLLPELAADYLRGADRVTDRFQAFLKGCGLAIHKPGTGPGSETRDAAGKPIHGTAKRAVLQYGFHSLRHSAVSLLREGNAPQAAVAAIVGHTSKSMTNRYTHVGESVLRAAVGGMPALAPNGARALPAPQTGALRRVAELAKSLNGKNWQSVRAELLSLVASAAPPAA